MPNLRCVEVRHLVEASSVVEREKGGAFPAVLTSPPQTDVVIPMAGEDIRARAVDWLPNSEKANAGSGKSLASISVSSDCKINDTNSMI